MLTRGHSYRKQTIPINLTNRFQVLQDKSNIHEIEHEATNVPCITSNATNCIFKGNKNGIGQTLGVAI